MSQKLTSEMIEHVAGGGQVPYARRLSLSKFLGQPLDSTMTPHAILSAQPKPPAPVPQAQGQPPAAPPHAKGSLKALSKAPPLMQTTQQARMADKLSGS